MKSSLCILWFGLLLGWPALAEDKPDVKPYPTVITSQAKSQPGVFKVHQIKDKLYYEIPAANLERDFLLVTSIARSTVGLEAAASLDQRVVRWHKHDNKILLLDMDYSVYADPHQAIAQGVDAANNPSILFAFPIEALGPGNAPVIEVSRMFLTDSLELSPKRYMRAKSLDAGRSFVDRVHAFPENIEVESSLTLTRDDSPSGSATFGLGMPQGTATVVMHYSMVRLPAQPMKPRLADSRVGYFSVRQYDYGQVRDHVEERRYVCRWRLEKKDPAAALSEPIKPIVFYIDPATPPQWVPFIKKGVEDWQPAFEEAGFKNAILARDAPKDPAWSPEDARYPVIRWVPSTIRNAFGPHTSDPRSGEILWSDVHMYENVIDLLRVWYLTQVGPLDERARHLPLPEPLMGRLLEYVAAHEVGHALGLPHNMKASSLYPVAKLRDRQWLHTMGHTPTLMDYCRFNYVAQPEDKIPAEDLVPRIGPYDRFAIKWAYTPIPGAASADAEKSTLDTWAREQDATPWLRFSTPAAAGLDPGDQTEAVGDADAVSSTALGLRNLQRVMAMLPGAATETGEPYTDLKSMYDHTVGQWRTELGHVLPLVGGVDSQEKHAGQAGPVFRTVEAARQARAVRFLLDNAFHAPAWLQPHDILSRVTPGGGLDTIADNQAFLLRSLVRRDRLQRLSKQAADPRAYSAERLLADVRQGIFQEIYSSGPMRIDWLRRRLQLILASQLGTLAQLDGSGDEVALARAQLRTLLADLRRAQPRARNRVESAHLAGLADRIVRSLDTRPAQPSTTVSRPALAPEEGCWEDYQLLK